MADQPTPQASTSARIHLLFDECRPPAVRVTRQNDERGRLHLNFEVDSVGWPTHDAMVTFTATATELLTLLDQAKVAVQAATRPPADQATEVA
jgi:hypothetical protein